MVNSVKYCFILSIIDFLINHNTESTKLCAKVAFLLSSTVIDLDHPTHKLRTLNNRSHCTLYRVFIWTMKTHYSLRCRCACWIHISSHQHYTCSLSTKHVELTLLSQPLISSVRFPRSFILYFPWNIMFYNGEPSCIIIKFQLPLQFLTSTRLPSFSQGVAILKIQLWMFCSK